MDICGRCGLSGRDCRQALLVSVCVDADGKKTYTDGECPGTTVARIVRVPDPPPQIKPLSPAPAPVSVPVPHQNSIYVNKNKPFDFQGLSKIGVKKDGGPVGSTFNIWGYQLKKDLAFYFFAFVLSMSILFIVGYFYILMRHRGRLIRRTRGPAKLGHSELPKDSNS